MITIRHVEIYRKYGGDGDVLTRCATSEEKAIMDYRYWSQIDSLIQDLPLIQKRLASDSFIKSTDEKLKENCDDEATIQALKEVIFVNERY